MLDSEQLAVLREIGQQVRSAFHDYDQVIITYLIAEGYVGHNQTRVYLTHKGQKELDNAINQSS